jgi:hypothetical protein
MIITFLMSSRFGMNVPQDNFCRLLHPVRDACENQPFTAQAEN